MAPQALGTLLRRHGPQQFDQSENAVQEALLDAYEKWPAQGMPSDPLAWLVTAARRRLIDSIRADARRRRRELVQERLTLPLPYQPLASRDDSLEILVLCCHPALTLPVQVALTLRAVGGLTTAQIAHAYLVPETTMAQRITRAKVKIRDLGSVLVPATDIESRLEPVLAALYLMFNEGHTATTGNSLYDTDLTREAMRLADQVHATLPAHAEAASLLALMLLTDARRAARTDPAGNMLALDEQDRRLWDRQKIRDGIALVESTLPGRRPAPYMVQAAIAALHAQAPNTAETDWPQILVLYKLLQTISDSPVVRLNRAVAEAMVHGPGAGLSQIAELAERDLPNSHRLSAVRGHLLEQADRLEEAEQAYLDASRRATSTLERDYLRRRARSLRARLDQPSD